MRLGWYDRSYPSKVYTLPKRAEQLPLDANLDRTAYARRFFAEIEGLGNIGIVRMKGTYSRTVALRGL